MSDWNWVTFISFEIFRTMTIGIATVTPQHSTSTNLVRNQYIDVQGHFTKNEINDETEGSEDNNNVTTWTFVYDIGGRRKQLTVINPQSLIDDSNTVLHVNRYYRVTGYFIEPQQSSCYLFFLSAKLA